MRFSRKMVDFECTGPSLNGEFSLAHRIQHPQLFRHRPGAKLAALWSPESGILEMPSFHHSRKRSTR